MIIKTGVLGYDDFSWLYTEGVVGYCLVAPYVILRVEARGTTPFCVEIYNTTTPLGPRFAKDDCRWNYIKDPRLILTKKLNKLRVSNWDHVNKFAQYGRKLKPPEQIQNDTQIS